MGEVSDAEIDFSATDELSLVSLAQRGNKQASETLLARYTPLVCALCKDKYLPGAEDKDLMQEGFIGVASAIKGYSSASHLSFSGFVSLCVERQIATALKNANRKKHGPLNSYVSFQEHVSGDEGNTYEEELLDKKADSKEPTPEEILIRQEDEKLLNSQLKKILTSLELDVLLGILEGRSYSEIATALCISEKSVDNARQRIKSKLLKNSLFEKN